MPSQRQSDAKPKWSKVIHDWIINHDDSWLFTIAYVSLAVVLSISISLFWLVVVVAIHFGFEWVRHRQHTSNLTQIVAKSLWNIKLDVALIIFALSLTAYMDVILGLAGLGGMARLGLQGGARLGGWSKALRGILLSLDDAAQVARAAAGKLSDHQDDVLQSVSLSDGHTSWKSWTIGDHFSIWFGLICFVMIGLAPWLTDHSVPSLMHALLTDLHPFPPAETE